LNLKVFPHYFIMADPKKMNPAGRGLFEPAQFTPNQLQIVAFRHGLADVAEAAGLGVLQLEASTGYKATLTVSKLLSFDLAIFRINEKLAELGFQRVDSSLIYNLLCRTLDDPLPVQVHVRCIQFVFNNLHKTIKLKVDYLKHRLHWGKAFDDEVEATKDARKTEDGKDENLTLLQQINWERRLLSSC